MAARPASAPAPAHGAVVSPSLVLPTFLFLLGPPSFAVAAARCCTLHACLCYGQLNGYIPPLLFLLRRGPPTVFSQRRQQSLGPRGGWIPPNRPAPRSSSQRTRAPWAKSRNRPRGVPGYQPNSTTCAAVGFVRSSTPCRRRAVWWVRCTCHDASSTTLPPSHGRRLYVSASSQRQRRGVNCFIDMIKIKKPGGYQKGSNCGVCVCGERERERDERRGRVA